MNSMKKRGVIEEHFLNKIVLFVDFKTMYLGRDLNQQKTWIPRLLISAKLITDN